MIIKSLSILGQEADSPVFRRFGHSHRLPLLPAIVEIQQPLYVLPCPVLLGILLQELFFACPIAVVSEGVPFGEQRQDKWVAGGLKLNIASFCDG